MSKKLLVGILIIGLVASLAVGAIYAYRGSGRGRFNEQGFMGNNGEQELLGKGMGAGPEDGSNRLNLTDEQKEKIKEIMENLRENEKSIFEKIKSEREEERGVLDATPLDQNRLSSLVDENITYINEILDLREDAYVEIEKVLTAEQRQKYISSLAFLTGRFVRGKGRPEEGVERTIRDWLFLAKKLNLTDEQKEILKNLIEETRQKAVKRGIEMKVRGLSKKLDLTDEQKESLKNIIKDELQSEREIFKELMEITKSEREIISKESFVETALRSSISQVKGKLNEILSLRKDMYLDIVNLLTDEQRTKMPTSIFFLSPGFVHPGPKR